MGISDVYSDTYELDQRFKPFPTLPTVVWAIDGHEVLVDNDWACTATDRGGFEEALIRVYDSDRFPRGIMRGMSMVATERESGWVVWAGTVDGEPQTRGLALEIRGVGNKKLLTDNQLPWLEMTRDIRLFSDAHDPPFSFASTDDTDEIEAELKRAGFIFGVEKNEAQVNNARHLLAAWIPGTTISGAAFSYRKTWNNGSHDLRFGSFIGPQGGLTDTADINLAAGAANTWLDEDVTFATPRDGMAFGFRVNTGDTWATKQIVRVNNLRIYGHSSVDSKSALEVMQGLGADAGLDTSRVAGRTNDVMPLLWQGSSRGDLATYLADITDQYWGVYERSFGGSSILEFDSYDNNTWEVSGDSGAIVQHCDPIRPFSGIVMRYQSIGGEERVLEWPAPVDPNEGQEDAPWAAMGLEDPQHSFGLAQSSADWNLPYLTGEMWDLNVLVTHATQNGRPVSPYSIRPNGTITVTDCHPHGSATDRIQECRYTGSGVEVTCNNTVDIGEQIVIHGDRRNPDLTRPPRAGHGRRRKRPRIPRR